MNGKSLETTKVCRSHTQAKTHMATIQPIVPHTRTTGNCLVGLDMWEKARELLNAPVGASARLPMIESANQAP